MTADEAEIILCECGCGLPVPHAGTGRPPRFATAACRKRFQRSNGTLPPAAQASDVAPVVEAAPTGCPHPPSRFSTLGSRRYLCGRCGASVRWEGLRKDASLRLVVESNNGSRPPSERPCAHPVSMQSQSPDHRGQQFCLDCRSYL